MVPGSDRPQTGSEDGDERWSSVLQQVHEGARTGRPWYQEVGIFFAWAAGIAVGTGVAALLILLLVDLFSTGRLFTARSASDWLFWAASLLLFSGLLAPSAADVKDSSSTRQTGGAQRSSATQRSARIESSESSSTRSPAERRAQAVRKRLLRVYNPWRWRLWASAFFCFGLSVLAGLLVQA
jgi:hypothetical protein